MQRLPRFAALLLLPIAALVTTACEEDTPTRGHSHARGSHSHAHGDHDHDHDHDHAHHHEAPHGGTLVALGDHFANLELVLDSPANKLTAYILDGHASQPIRLAQEEVKLSVAIDGAEHELVLQPVANELTGEGVGNTSQFSATSDVLAGATQFQGKVNRLLIKGKEFTSIEFQFPGPDDSQE